MTRLAALLGGTHSGCGKTTVMLALLQTLQRAGITVDAFKCGPDFLDPLWHQAVTGRPSRNLDTFMVGAELCLEQLHASANVNAYGLIEGMMGLFDGKTGVGEAGSSLDLAGILGVPVLLVADVQGMSGSIVALVKGYCGCAWEKGVQISGIIANRVGSQGHAELVAQLLSERNLPPLVAWLGSGAPAIKERHLGLCRPQETALPDLSGYFHADIPGLFTAFAQAKPALSVRAPEPLKLSGKTVAIARDEACCFIYPANVEWLISQGARPEFFSPLNGEALPEHTDAVWLPGGYPELYGAQLANSGTWASLRQFIEDGGPVLAECGGMMLLGQSLTGIDQHTWPMAGILPFTTRMHGNLAALGYRELACGAKGHEFHYSSRDMPEDVPPAFPVNQGDCGLRYKNVRASYIHWYFASAGRETARWFLV